VCRRHIQKLGLSYLECECKLCVGCVSEHAGHSFCSVKKNATQREELRTPLTVTTNSPSLVLEGARRPIITHTCHHRYADQRFITY
jgi:hypothetical protein